MPRGLGEALRGLQQSQSGRINEDLLKEVTRTGVGVHPSRESRLCKQQRHGSLWTAQGREQFWMAGAGSEGAVEKPERARCRGLEQRLPGTMNVYLKAMGSH